MPHKRSVLRPRIEWYQTLEEPYRTQAIENSPSRALNQRVSNIVDALHSGFLWADSPQKHEYWENHVIKLIDEKQGSKHR